MSRPGAEHSCVLESGHGCLAVFGAVPPDAAVLDVGGTVVEWLDVGGGSPPTLVVKGGSQFGPYAVTVHVLDAEPEDDASWEDVTEVSLVAEEPLSLGDVEDGPTEAIPVPAGSYRMRAGTRGRTEGAARDATFPDEDDADDLEPIEHMLLELWAAAPAPAVVVRETSTFAHDLVDPPAPDWPAEREPGLEAARRVAADLRAVGARTLSLSGEPGEVDVTLVVPGTRVRVFNRVKFATGWPPANGGTLSLREKVGQVSRHYGDPPDSDGLAPLLGMVEMEVLELAKPERIVLSWNWRVAGPDGRPFPTNPVLLAQPARVELTCLKADPVGGEPRTTVTVRHSGVPREWVDDLPALWAWEIVRYAAL